MHRTKGSSSTTLLGRAPQWSQADVDEEAGFYNEVRQVTGNIEQIPLSKDERVWIRVPVSVFLSLIYNPISWLLRPLHPVFTTPQGLVGFLIVFMIIFVPFFIGSGYLSSITKPYPQKSPH
ncbi:uncharacterized protein B0J16DRAFT_333724 [Fusarium flagelliforme]|uniref:uncharacterized protein n=1 Tax=Fusarium flagelliforme TaxID=2675880 RepID=UPI001E8D56B4|nr:uncharacterized protein B0J16DRAFT_333724 [Fusarium flagelliforme]KAH7192774.1 hypothetical protein B0J16DRAFT_333724 [Fusarium flagelliforme]